jgi:phosphate transport system ATP-binding protein
MAFNPFPSRHERSRVEVSANAADAEENGAGASIATTAAVPATAASTTATFASSSASAYVSEYAPLGVEPLDPAEYERTRRENAQAVRDKLFGPAPAGGLQAKNITAWFGDHKVLDRVSLDMAAGEVTALIGPSGCGKSTFLRILNRMHELVPTASLSGEVLLDDNDIYNRGERITGARRAIGMVFQKPNPFPAMSIYDNVVSGTKLAGVRANRDEKDILVEDALRKASLWDEVKDRLDQPGGGLSGGQQQRLCIGQVTIVIVTHNMQQARRVSSQCAFFLAAQGEPGGIVEYGETEAMFTEPQDSRTHDYVNGRFG